MWDMKRLHSTPSLCSAFSFQLSVPLIKLDRGKPAHLWYKQTPNWWMRREQEKHLITMQPLKDADDFPEFSPPDSCLLMWTGSRWQIWRLWKQSKFSYFLISPEKNVWSLVIYYLFFGPWYFALSFGFQLLILQQQETFPWTFQALY